MDYARRPGKSNRRHSGLRTNKLWLEQAFWISRSKIQAALRCVGELEFVSADGAHLGEARFGLAVPVVE